MCTLSTYFAVSDYLPFNGTHYATYLLVPTMNSVTRDLFTVVPFVNNLLTVLSNKPTSNWGEQHVWQQTERDICEKI